jgi:hypothetical protein
VKEKKRAGGFPRYSQHLDQTCPAEKPFPISNPGAALARAPVGTKSREVIWAPEDAKEKAAREADRAEAEAWSIRMEGYGGPAHPSLGHA